MAHGGAQFEKSIEFCEPNAAKSSALFQFGVRLFVEIVCAEAPAIVAP
jgi:hypothetical protein